MAIAALLGVDVLRDAMADFCESGPVPRSITTAELERHSYCVTGEPSGLRQAFHRFVHGQGGSAHAPALDYCM